jgi:hypothetical protein
MTEGEKREIKSRHQAQFTSWGCWLFSEGCVTFYVIFIEVKL